MPLSNPNHLSPTGQRVTPAVFAVTATGTAHRAGSQDGARANAIDVLMTFEQRQECERELAGLRLAVQVRIIEGIRP